MPDYVQITIIGVTIVFLVLAILYVIFNVLGRLLSREQGHGVKAVSEKTTPDSVLESPRSVVGDEGNVMAAIAASVNAVIGHSDFRIRSVSPIPSARASQWKRREPTVYWKVRRSRN
ncbi:MAG: OadG family protein [Kosmotogaceae bacterium]|nr:OadG family protein [Kosmotogaceae bacterium]